MVRWNNLVSLMRSRQKNWKYCKIIYDIWVYLLFWLIVLALGVCWLCSMYILPLWPNLLHDNGHQNNHFHKVLKIMKNNATYSIYLSFTIFVLFTNSYYFKNTISSPMFLWHELPHMWLLSRGMISIGHNRCFGSYMTFPQNVSVLKESGTSFLRIKKKALAAFETLKNGAENQQKCLPLVVAYLGILRTAQFSLVNL